MPITIYQTCSQYKIERTKFSQLFCLLNQPKNLSPLCGISPVCGSSIMGIVLLEENILRFWAYFQIGEREAYLCTFNAK